MKKIVLSFFLLLICISTCNLYQNTAYASSNYAQIINSGCYLYKSANIKTSITNVWCEIENTYFVELLTDYNDNFYKANYNSIIGFIKKIDIKKVTSTPYSPYPSGINVEIKDSGGCYLRSSPESKIIENNVITTLSKGESNILFIGKIDGDESIDLKGNLWYLVKFGNNIGYIYSDYVKSKVTLFPNIEQMTYVDNSTYSTLLNPLTNKTTLAIVIIILCPTFIILILLFKPRKITAKVRKHGHELKQIDIKEVTDLYNDIDL